MRAARFLMICAVVLVSGNSAAQPADWLVGSWVGALGDWHGRVSPERVLTVKSAADGKAVGNMSTTTNPDGNVKTTIAVNGDTVEITAGKSVTMLKREGERLVGTSTLANGNQHPISLTKVADPAAPAVTYAGTVRGNSSCFANSTEMEVTLRGNRGAGNWATTSGKLYFAGEAPGDKLEAIVKIDGYQVQVKAEKRGDAVEASLSSTKGCYFSGSLAKR